jgi:hypothetical protein
MKTLDRRWLCHVRFWRKADVGETGDECPVWRKADIPASFAALNGESLASIRRRLASYGA